jgi:group I intron endonuclease
MRFEVYKHTAPNGKAYVGVTRIGVARRWGEHVAASRNGTVPVHAAIRKYGADAFSHETLEVMTTEAGAKRAEQLWIAELGTFGATGYNATRGGEGRQGVRGPLSSEHRAALSRVRKGRVPWAAIRASAEQRRPHTAETRAKIAAGHARRPQRAATCHPDRAHYCRGLCERCAGRERTRAYRARKAGA